jgi:signal transduction histidine kinase
MIAGGVVLTGLKRHGRAAVRTVAGTILGAVLACVAVAVGVLAAAGWLVVAPIPSARRRVVGRLAAVRDALLGLEQRRVRGLLLAPPAHPANPGETVAYLASRTALGLFGGGTGVLLLLASASYLGWTLVLLLLGRSAGPVLVGAALGAAGLYISIQLMVLVARVDSGLAGRFDGAPGEQRLRQRINQLQTSRAEVLEAVDLERRRIERDLHDGVQQRLVALGMLLGRARRLEDRRRADRLYAQAHDEAQSLVRDLREVVWRVYPSALDDGGLAAALEIVAERSTVPVKLDVAIQEPLPVAVQTAAYYVVSEAVTNTAKHADARAITVTLAQVGGQLLIEVEDDGRGGADPAGGGLSGLRRRVAALDGTLRVESPAGGPTRINACVPCV